MGEILLDKLMLTVVRSRLLAGLFDVVDFVAQLRGLLVVFAGHRLFHFAPQTNELRLLFGVSAKTLGHFSHVMSFVVDVQEQWLQLLCKAGVVVWTPETTLLAEFSEADAADRTNLLIEPRQLLGGFAHGQLLCEKTRHGRHHIAGVVGGGREKRLSTIFAQVQFVGLAVHQVGDVEGRLLVTLLALHGGQPELVGVGALVVRDSIGRGAHVKMTASAANLHQLVAAQQHTVGERDACRRPAARLL